MAFSISAAPAAEILPWRERRLAELPGPRSRRSALDRPGWAEGYLISDGAAVIGYGVVLVGHIWTGQRLITEFHLEPSRRSGAPEIFAALAAAVGATGVRGPTHDPALAPFLVGDPWIEKLLFVDETTTHFPAPSCRFRALPKEEAGAVFAHEREPVGNWCLEREGRVVATGAGSPGPGATHCDIYYEVARPYRRQGLGTYLVQELKRNVRERGAIPTACCDPDNDASHRTLLRGGFRQYGDLRTVKYGK